MGKHNKGVLSSVVERYGGAVRFTMTVRTARRRWNALGLVREIGFDPDNVAPKEQDEFNFAMGLCYCLSQTLNVDVAEDASVGLKTLHDFWQLYSSGAEASEWYEYATDNLYEGVVERWISAQQDAEIRMALKREVVPEGLSEEELVDPK